MPVGNIQQAKVDRSTLPSWPESIEFHRDSASRELHQVWLDDYNPRVLVGLFGVEYVLALQFSRLYNPMWWMDGIRAVQPEASTVQPVARRPGEELPAGAGTPGDGQRDGVDQSRGEGTLESQRRQHDYVPTMAEVAQKQLSPFDSVGNWRSPK